MKKLIFSLIFGICWVFISSCASTIYLYDEPELPKNEIATLIVPVENFQIYMINGKEVKKRKKYMFNTVLKAKEGRHRIGIRVESRRTKEDYTDHISGTRTDMVEKNRIVDYIFWEAKGGHIYKFELNVYGLLNYNPISIDDDYKDFLKNFKITDITND